VIIYNKLKRIKPKQPKLRDKRFIAEHRGGLLKKEQHRQIISWACYCAEHILPLLDFEKNEQLKNVLNVGKEWEKEIASTGDARKASMDAITVANEASDQVSIAVARAVGHAVATAHMADHSLVAANYALKAIQLSGNSTDDERKWQNDQLPVEIRELVLSARSQKEKNLKTD
jgi:hypothetical protein